MRKLLFLVGIALSAACNSEPPVDAEVTTEPVVADSAQWVIEQAIARHGGANLDTGVVKFDFRDRRYAMIREGNTFRYKRDYTDEQGRLISDILTNIAFTRVVDGRIATLSEKDSSAYANSLNSVMYFAFLPYFLNDEAVQAEYQGVSEAFGTPHHELLVTFRQDGGGKDFEDEYAYWFAADDFRLNYLAYNFLVDGGGARFREAYNAREVEGIRVQDYLNYKPTDATRRDVLNFDELYRAGGLDTLSRIELENVAATEEDEE